MLRDRNGSEELFSFSSSSLTCYIVTGERLKDFPQALLKALGGSVGAKPRAEYSCLSCPCYDKLSSTGCFS